GQAVTGLPVVLQVEAELLLVDLHKAALQAHVVTRRVTEKEVRRVVAGLRRRGRTGRAAQRRTMQSRRQAVVKGRARYATRIRQELVALVVKTAAELDVVRAANQSVVLFEVGDDAVERPPVVAFDVGVVGRGAEADVGDVRPSDLAVIVGQSQFL